ncbi:hypothetical protein CHS0354_009350 [Potamilus streckersoni]|uniref:THD domain-containing protein n=1 Tax=Potamilus streckersoni TaxID=2493646 RepID=A0AAE0TFF3_9BIVA|nr:hypothetical protein CHS0354_009350 [Potamilus streckersoni]
MPTTIKEKNVTSRFVIVELIILVSLSGVLIVICYFWIHGENSHTESESRKQYCIPCRNISLNVDEDIENFRDLFFQQGEYVQCCAGQDMIPKIIEWSVERHRRKRISSGLVSGVPQSCVVPHHEIESQGSAKVVGFSESITGYSVPNSYLTILYWDKGSSLSFIGSDVGYRNGSLVIGRSAYYTVYSQIMFNQSLQRDDEDEFKTFVHLIYKHTDDTDHKYDLKLLENFKSLCQPKIIDCTGASHISSVFFLRKYDEINVRVNDLRRVISSPFGNFFGIFPVS